MAALEARAAAIEAEPQTLESIDDRLFELRKIARRHSVPVDDLGGLRDSLAQRLAGLDDQESRLAAAAKRAAELRDTYVKAAEALSTARRKAAERLDAAVARELKPLKLERAHFVTEIASLAEVDWGEAGIDRSRLRGLDQPRPAAWTVGQDRVGRRVGAVHAGAESRAGTGFGGSSAGVRRGR